MIFLINLNSPSWINGLDGDGMIFEAVSIFPQIQDDMHKSGSNGLWIIEVLTARGSNSKGRFALFSCLASCFQIKLWHSFHWSETTHGIFQLLTEEASVKLGDWNSRFWNLKVWFTKAAGDKKTGTFCAKQSTSPRGYLQRSDMMRSILSSPRSWNVWYLLCNNKSKCTRCLNDDWIYIQIQIKTWFMTHTCCTTLHSQISAIDEQKLMDMQRYSMYFEEVWSRHVCSPDM